MRRLVLVTAIFGAACVASAQSIFVDAEVGLGDEGAGLGVPTSDFGAAAGIPGYWNAAWWSNDPFALRDIAGSMTGAQLRVLGGPSRSGFRFVGNTGNYARLLNDTDNVDVIGGPSRYVFTGLQSGQYRVFTYACHPRGEVAYTNIEVVGGLSAGVQTVTGPMPGNAFALGITHVVHQVPVTNGTLTIIASQGGANWQSHVNGYQLVLVPEPASILWLAAATICALLLKAGQTTKF
jgi:hypothetical protein